MNEVAKHKKVTCAQNYSILLSDISANVANFNKYEFLDCGIQQAKGNSSRIQNTVLNIVMIK